MDFAEAKAILAARDRLDADWLRETFELQVP